MIMGIQIALRNVLRNPRRTLLSLVIISLGTGMLFAVSGFVSFITDGITESTVEQYGNLQIADVDLWNRVDDRALTLLDGERVNQLEAILDELSEVTGYAAQLTFTSQIQKGSESSLLFGVGVDPANRILTGYEIDRGVDLQPGDSGKIVIGRLLADNLGVEPGDYVTLLIATINGSFNTGQLQVVGIFRGFESLYESQFAYVPISTAQMLLNTRGVDKIVVKLSDIRITDSVAAVLSETLTDSGTGSELRTWDELATQYKQTVGMFSFILGAVSLGIFVLVFFSILEVLTMSFMERTREVGTLRAIGTKRKHVFRLFLTEGALLGVMGGILGILVGVGLGVLVNHSGVGWTPPGALEEVPILVKLSPISAVAPLAIAVLSTLISAVFPALHSARLQVVDALRSQ
jgi:putative ABC transport system permease protein